MAPKSLLLAALAAFSSASPIGISDAESALQQRSAELNNRDVVCTPQNMGIDTSRTDCPKKQTMKDDSCKNHIPNVPDKAGCSAYCETRITVRYGREAPFPVGTCPEKVTCTVDKSQSVAVTNTYEINASFGIAKRGDPEDEFAPENIFARADESASKLTASFNVGASYSWSKTVTYGTTTRFSLELKDNECGYWTFVPFMIESCGTLTTYPRKTMPAGYYGSNQAPYCDKKSKPTDHANWCNTTPYKDSNGHPDGRVIFVHVDCKTNKLLPMDKQDEVYRYSGVSTGPQ